MESIRATTTGNSCLKPIIFRLSGVPNTFIQNGEKMSDFMQANNGSFTSTVAKQSNGAYAVDANAKDLATTVPVEDGQTSKLDDTEKLLLYKLEQAQKSNPGSHDEIDILARLSRYYIGANKLESSMECLGNALVCSEKLYGKNHPVVAELLVESAFVAFKVESYEDALEFLTPAIDIYESCYGKVSDQVAFAFHKLGRVYEAVNKLDQAEEFYQKSETTYQNTFNEDDSEMYVVRNDLARVRSRK